MKLESFSLFVLVILNIVGCSSITSTDNPVIQDISPLSCSISELEKFMAFSIHFSTLSDTEKKIECDKLRFNYNVLNDWNSGWSLAYAINNYSGCGTINEGISILKKIRDTKLNSEQIEWLLDQHILLLGQLKTIKIQNRINNSLHREIKLLNEQLSNCQDKKNTMLLKLHELKSIETSINKRLEEEQK